MHDDLEDADAQGVIEGKGWGYHTRCCLRCQIVLCSNMMVVGARCPFYMSYCGSGVRSGMRGERSMSPTVMTVAIDESRSERYEP